MEKLKLLLLAALMSWGFSANLSAGLAWEQKSRSFTPAASEIEVIGHFKFQNKGTSTISIKSAVASCSCTAVSIPQQSYAPGETGEIVAKFTIEDRVGVQRLEIALETTDQTESPITLAMDVTVPKIADVAPDPLRWLPGDPLVAKRIRVTVAQDIQLSLTAVKSSDTCISAKIEPGVQAGQYDLVVTPRDDITTFSGSLRIETDFPKAHPRAIIAHVQVAR